MIFSKNIFKNFFRENSFKKPVTKLSFSHAASLKPVTLLKNESFHKQSLSAVILRTPLLRNYSEQRQGQSLIG